MCSLEVHLLYIYIYMNCVKPKKKNIYVYINKITAANQALR